jgi:hypothetical protein
VVLVSFRYVTSHAEVEQRRVSAPFHGVPGQVQTFVPAGWHGRHIGRRSLGFLEGEVGQPADPLKDLLWVQTTFPC